MYRRYLALLFLTGIAISAVAGDDRELFEEAQRRFSSGAYQLAIDQFQSLLTEYPGSTYATRSQLRVAQSYFYLGNYDQALEILQRAAVRVRGGGELPREIRFWIGLTRFRLGQYESAIGDFTTYLAEPGAQTARAYLYRGIALLEGDDPTAARDDLERSRDGLEGDEWSWATTLLLRVLSDSELSDEALALYERTDVHALVEVYREPALRIAADAAYALERLDKAQELYTELTAFSMGSAQWAYQRLYEIAVRRGDRAEMDVVFREAEQRLSGEPERLSAFWLALGADAIAAERYQLAEFYLSRLWRIRQERDVPGTVALYLARSIEAQGRQEEALSVLVVSLDEPGVSEEAIGARYLAAARILLDLGRPGEAATLMESYPRVREESQALYAWSLAAYRTGDLPAVIDRLDTPAATAFSRDVPALTRVLARALLEAGNPREAVPAFRSYLSVRPDDIDARVELVRALVSAEQFPAALQEIDKLDKSVLTAGQLNEIAYLEGLGLFHRRSYAAALDAFRGVGDNAYEPLLSYHVAWSLYRLGEIAEAGRTVGAVREALPGTLYVDGSYLYAWSLYQQGRTEQTIAVLLPLLGAGPDGTQTIDIRQLLAGAYLAEGADEDALRQYLTIVEESEGEQRVVYWSRYASVLAALGRDQDAVREYDEIAEQFPRIGTGREALLEAGQILFTGGSYAAARERFRTYRNRYPDGASLDRALFWGGQSSAALGEGERALLWWDPLVIEYPRSTYTPRALFRSAEIHRENNRTREALELYDRYVAAYPGGGNGAQAERYRQELRLEQAGLTDTEAALWTELEPDAGNAPEPGSERWFELVLELGRMAIREQITLSFQRNRIVPKLQEASEFSGEPAARADILLAEYYQRRGETRRAVERYIAAAATDGAPDELRAQSLFRLAETANEEGDAATVQEATRQLRERYPDSIWADQAERFSGGAR